MYLMDTSYDFSQPGKQFRPRNQHPVWLVQEFARSGKPVRRHRGYVDGLTGADKGGPKCTAITDIIMTRPTCC